MLKAAIALNCWTLKRPAPKLHVEDFDGFLCSAFVAFLGYHALLDAVEQLQNHALLDVFHHLLLGDAGEAHAVADFDVVGGDAVFLGYVVEFGADDWVSD